MEIVVANSADEVGRIAAERVVRECSRRPEPVLGVATGSSPLTTYQQLAALQAAGRADLRRARVFALDEYLGLHPDDPHSYTATVRRTVTEPLGLDPERVHVPDADAADPALAAEQYEQLIREAGGVDVQLLGIGGNGHIGFNEPGSGFATRTRLVTLSDETRHANARFFDGDATRVPRQALSQGLGTILAARAVVLVALGEGKAEAVAAALNGPVDEQCPASCLQRHPEALVVLDRAAAAGLR